MGGALQRLAWDVANELPSHFCIFDTHISLNNLTVLFLLCIFDMFGAILAYK